MNKVDIRPVRILVVDDEQIVREVICSALEGPNTFIIDTSDGESAISLLLREPFDLVIADKNLPGITGMDVIRRAKAIDSCMGAMLITAYADRDSAEEAMAIGVDNYIEKPFGISDLENKVKEALERRAIGQRPKDAKIKRANSRKIGIYEPEPTNLSILVEGVKLLGHQPKVLSEALEVIETLRNREIDTLICNSDLLHCDNPRAYFLRSTLLVHPEIRFVAVSKQRNVDGIIKAIHHYARKILYLPLNNAKTVAEELRGFLSYDKES